MRGDVVDLDIDSFLLAPILAELGQRVVCAGDPMVPETEAQLSRGVGAVHKGRGERGGRAGCGCALQNGAAGIRSRRQFSLPVCRCEPVAGFFFGRDPRGRPAQYAGNGAKSDRFLPTITLVDGRLPEWNPW